MTDTPPLAPEETHRFPCDNCGADYRFDPESGILKCDHCGHEADWDRDEGSAHIRELDFRAALDAALPGAEMVEARVSTCPNCAAHVQFDDAQHAAECPFCATPVVVDTGTERLIKPRAVAPFELDEPKARNAMTEWLGGLWFAPNGLQEYARKGRKMRGVYVPYWTYDADTKSSYTGARGTVYYVTETYTDNGQTKTRQVQKVRWTPVMGRVARWFDDVLVLASKSLPKRYTDALQPWNLSALRPYRAEFLSGFDAEGYTVELSDGYDEARGIMDARIRSDIRMDIGGDRQRIATVDTVVKDVTFKHILLPVWIAAYHYRGKSYRFVVNGQTGRVQGERPWSVIKITIAVLIGAAIAGVIGYFVAQS